MSSDNINIPDAPKLDKYDAAVVQLELMVAELTPYANAGAIGALSINDLATLLQETMTAHDTVTNIHQSVPSQGPGGAGTTLSNLISRVYGLIQLILRLIMRRLIHIFESIQNAVNGDGKTLGDLDPSPTIPTGPEL
jgi:hypothetical protein